MDVAALVVPVVCPACGGPIADICRIQWGACPRDALYHPGDEVEWIRSADGRVVPPFRLVGGRWNCGRPEVADVLLKDPTLLGGPIRCPGCGATYEGVAVEVRSGRFSQARPFGYDELADDADAFERLPDGSLQGHPEWQDQPVLPLGD